MQRARAARRPRSTLWPLAHGRASRSRSSTVPLPATTVSSASELAPPAPAGTRRRPFGEAREAQRARTNRSATAAQASLAGVLGKSQLVPTRRSHCQRILAEPRLKLLHSLTMLAASRLSSDLSGNIQEERSRPRRERDPSLMGLGIEVLAAARNCVSSPYDSQAKAASARDAPRGRRAAQCSSLQGAGEARYQQAHAGPGRHVQRARDRRET